MSGDDTEKKRKHDNILSTEEESDDEDLVNMDQKNYISGINLLTLIVGDS
jgi:hypothetical protein